MVFKEKIKIFAFLASSLLRPTPERLGVDFGTKNRPKIVPRRLHKGAENHVCFLVRSRPSKNQFLSQHGPDMAPFWPQRWLQVGSKMASKSTPERSQKRGRLHNRVRDDFGSIWGRFWVDFGSILGRFWLDFGRSWLQLPWLAWAAHCI